ncbi:MULTISPECIES: PspC domain-containing protein [unclassified Paenibacillus]|uniref:PspC domain-containing protein n=1 Tax=unclassified Paenibacillus TaxID=185978 RepID=UPI001C0FF170|nr:MULTISPECIES: PspC domain-containing protein [unclassified Paenibacillus]MBU5441347.1 PspC domain-containing protein [Paenibacillus sp. MSJ-34]CAH0120915.1 hypothetical protein PAE9249_03439 [Paenibacillus sp. CECT 9249]
MNKLYRSRMDSKLTGLCGGVAEWLGVGSGIVRLLVIISALFSFGTVALIYIVASLIVPKAPYGEPFYTNDYRYY